MDKNSQTIDTLLETFDLAKAGNQSKEDVSPVTLWIPTSSKEKYDLIQKMSGRKFSKVLRKVLVKSIDSVKMD